MNTAVEERLTDKIWAFYSGQHAEAVSWLQIVGGCKLIPTDSSGGSLQYIIHGVTGVRGALLYPPGDPVTLAVMFGFLLAGQLWPQVYPNILKMVNKRWKTELANAKRIWGHGRWWPQ